jgi:hypothetical protein
LADGFIVVGSPIGTFDGLDVLRLSDRGAEAIRCPKHLDEGAVVDNGVLTWKGSESFRADDPEDLAMTMEVGDSIIDGIQRVLVDHGTPYEMAEFDDICYSLNDFRRNVSRDGGEIDLYTINN